VVEKVGDVGISHSVLCHPFHDIDDAIRIEFGEREALLAYKANADKSSK
jgi:hypothetical protein